MNFAMYGAAVVIVGALFKNYHFEIGPLITGTQCFNWIVD